MTFKHRIYRGLSDLDYKLLSTLGRKAYPIEEIDTIEKRLLDSLKKEFEDSLSEWNLYQLPIINNDLFNMSLARHLGVDSRLMDWTASKDVAEYFAASGNPEKEGCVWCLDLPTDYLKDHSMDSKENPFQFTDDIRVLKLPFTGNDLSHFPIPIKRRWDQSGFFLYTRSELINTPLEEMSLEQYGFSLSRYTISQTTKRGILKRSTSISEKYKTTINESIEEKIKLINNIFNK